MIGLALALASGPKAEAHPHVWVDTVVTAIFSQGKVTSLREEWWFDEDFTVTALSDIRKTKGMSRVAIRPLTEGEIGQLRAQAFSNLANYAYFTHVWAAGKPIAVAREVTAFQARMDGARLAYSFTLPLAAPQDPRAGPLRIGVWDDSYYVDVGPAKGLAPQVEGDGSQGCAARIIDDKDHLLYFGAVTPKAMEIKC
ncbi:MAG TPA: DUF1007 family protein [Rhodospirillaceae bacterium]|nr:DUF1007 family protein [Rhodospirillaceae bacterium]